MKKKIIIFITLLLIIAGVVYFTMFKTPSIEQYVNESVVKIEIYDDNDEYVGSGSGFCLYKSNYIVTNYHVVEDGFKFKLITNDKKEYDVKRIEALNEKYDIAILSGDFNFKPIKLGDSNKIKVGEVVNVIGSPKGVLNIASEGIISNVNDDYNFNITAPISPGSSGGVVLNSKGQAIGVVRATYKDAQNLNYAIRIQYIKDMYDAIKNNKVIEVNEENYERFYVSMENFERYTRFYKENYYSFSNLSILYKLTDIKEAFEYSLASQKPDWYKLYNNLSSTKRVEIINDIINNLKHEIINDIENYANKYPADEELDVSNISDWKVKDLFIKPHLIEDYKFLILSAQLGRTEDKEKQKELVNSTDIEDEGLKCMILRYLGDYKLDEFTEEQRQKVSEFIQSKIEDKNNAKEVLKLIGFTVNVKDDNTLEVIWKK